MKELIKQLVETFGPSGHEGAVRALIEGILRQYVDELRVDAMGNLIVHKKGTGSGKRLMVAAHMDEIGLIVTYIDEKGYARFARIGGVSPLTLVGGRVRFANGVQGVISCEQWLQRQKLPGWSELFIDVGATSADDVPIRIGDVAAFERPFVDLGKRLVSKAMDDRISCAVLMQALMTVEAPANDIYAVFTAQEEVGVRGATVAAFGVEPDVGLAVDVTPAFDVPEFKKPAIHLGSGPAIKVMDSGLLAHPGVKDWMVRTAEGLGLSYQLEVLERGGTDAQAIQRSRAGVPAGCLSIPCRYVHSPSEMVDYGDVQGAVQLLVALMRDAAPV